MSIGNFLSVSFLALGTSMSPPAGDQPPAQVVAANQAAPDATQPSMQDSSMMLTRNTPTDVNGIETVCTGIDSDTRADPRWASYSLRLEFTAGGRAYVAYEQVTITGAKGAAVLAVRCPGAWVLAKLPAGKYSVSATVESGVTKHASVTVPKTGQARAVIRFPEVPAAESPNGEAGPNATVPPSGYHTVQPEGASPQNTPSGGGNPH